MSRNAHPDDSVPVVCTVCRTRMRATVAQIGQKIKCPDCDAQNIVRPPPAIPTKRRQIASGDDYRLVDDDRPPKPQLKTIKVTCGTCFTLMHARLEHAGKRIRCPDCDALTVIPRPPAERPAFQLPDTSDVHIEAAPAPEDDHAAQATVDRLMAKATAEIAEIEAAKPVPPQTPLRDGLVAFLFYSNVIGLWLLTWIGSIVNVAVLVAFVEAARSDGLAAITGVFLGPIWVAITLGLAALVAPHLLSIVGYTAEGFDRIPHWPSEDLFSRGRSILLLLIAALVATMPGAIVLSLPRAAGLPIPVVAMLLSTVIFYPAVVLSMLLNDSIFLPFSKEVFSSMTKIPHAWISIVGRMLLSGLALLGIDYLLNRLWPTGAVLITLLLLSLYVVYVHRLIGRMGWIISQIDDATDHVPETDEVPNTVPVP